MKRLFCIVLSMVLILTACGSPATSDSTESSSLSSSESSLPGEVEEKEDEAPSASGWDYVNVPGSTRDNEISEESSEPKKDVSEMTLEEAIDYAIEKSGAEKMKVVIEDTGEVAIVLAGRDNISLDYIRTGMLIDAEKIFKVLQPIPDYSQINIGFVFPVADKYGNAKWEVVMAILLEKDTLDKINFKNFLRSNFPDVADAYYESPDFFG